jgi:hypothetical protein
VPRLKPGEHRIRATYSGGRKCLYNPSSSPNLLHTVTRRKGRGYTVTKRGGHMISMGQASTRGRGVECWPPSQSRKDEKTVFANLSSAQEESLDGTRSKPGR